VIGYIAADSMPEAMTPARSRVAVDDDLRTLAFSAGLIS